jgi:uncharacterized protein
LNVYFDASVVVPLFLEDPFTARAEALLRTADLTPVISDWAALEVSNVISRRVRIGALSGTEALTTLEDFDLWRGRSALGAETVATDITEAILLVRRFDLALRAPDAVHLAIARRLRGGLITFDERMGAAAAILGIEMGA